MNEKEVQIAQLKSGKPMRNLSEFQSHYLTDLSGLNSLHGQSFSDLKTTQDVDLSHKF